MEFNHPGAADENQEDDSQVQDDSSADPEEPAPQEPEPAESQPEKPISQQAEPKKKRPSDPTEAFVHEMVESSKKPFDAPTPNKGGDEDSDEIEDITKKIRDRLQKRH